jgi:putative ABC transport system substrate-binding protein
VNRRTFLAAFGGCLIAAPVAATAQAPARVPRIGYLGLAPASAAASRLVALRQGLRDLGYVEGKNIAIEFRWATSVEELPGYAAEFARMNVDIIFAQSSTFVDPARQATHTIPIVFCLHADPVGTGHVASLSHPGGNVTGLSMVLGDIAAKELQMLSQALPRARQIAVLWDPSTPSHEAVVKALEHAGETLKLQLIVVSAQREREFAGAFSTMSRQGARGLLIVSSPSFSAAHRALLAELALKHRLPSMVGTKSEAQAGALMSYGADIDDLFRRSAGYIDKILRGARPADLPVEQPTKFELVVNMKTAKALGLALPPSFLLRADEVIQ